MKKIIISVFVLFIQPAFCQNSVNTENKQFTIAFGSCNKTPIKNVLWKEIRALQPDIWIWGGDNIYADTDNMIKLEKLYQKQNNIEEYQKLKATTPVLGTWDDHDYGLNDGGVEFEAKRESQQLFLDFMGVREDDAIRFQEGIYSAKVYEVNGNSVKIIVLDTRYFRTALTKSEDTKKRYQANTYGEGTILGEKQWTWFSKELETSKADFNIIVSSIQFLSREHGFETWGNFPHEVDRLKQICSATQAKGVILLSGDRHISEFSKTKIKGLSYPLVDFTSSGLTHAYSNFSGEPNLFRVGKVIATESFGVVSLNFETRKVIFKMIGRDGEVLQELWQNY